MIGENAPVWKEFSIRFGQTKVESTKTQRLEFAGKRTRNLEVDKINSYEEFTGKTLCFKVLILIFFFIALAISGLSSYYLLEYTRVAYRNNLIDTGNSSPSQSGEQVYPTTDSSLPAGYDAKKTYTCVPFCNPKFPACQAGLSVPCSQCDASCPTKEVFDSLGNPLIYELDDNLKVVSKKYLIER